MTTYTYSMFDGAPGTAGRAWPHQCKESIEAESDADALCDVLDLLTAEAARLNTSAGYAVGDRVHAVVWGQGAMIVGQPVHELTADDLGVDEECPCECDDY